MLVPECPKPQAPSPGRSPHILELPRLMRQEPGSTWQQTERLNDLYKLDVKGQVLSSQGMVGIQRHAGPREVSNP